MLSQSGDPFFVGFLEFFGVFGLPHFHTVIIDDNHLDTLCAHDRTDAAATGVTGGSEFHIGAGDRSGGEFHFAGRTNGDAADFFTIFGLHFVDQVIISEHA